MSGIGLPNLLKPTAMDRPMNQRLETDILFPATANQRSAKFVFDRKGILDSNSQLRIKLVLEKLDNGDEIKCLLPATTGIASVIQRAYLEVGGRRVATLDEVGQYVNWRRMRFSPEFREQIASIKQGGNDVFVGSATRVFPLVAPFGTIGRASNETSIQYFPNAGTQQRIDLNDAPIPLHQQLTADANTSPEFVLSLSQLIPMLRGVQLPLFAISQEVSLVVEFQDNKIAGRCYIPPRQANGAQSDMITQGKQALVSIPSLLIMADYLFYPGEMENLSDAIMSQGGYDIYYDEIQTQIASQGSQVAGSYDYTAQLALGGKKVKSIITKRLQYHKPISLFTAVADGDLNTNIGEYYAQAHRTPSHYNFVIDSKPFYAQDIKNEATLFSETSRIDDTPLRISQSQYSYKNAGGVNANNASSNFTDREYNTFPQQQNQGNYKCVGLRLSNAMGEGKRMSNLPVLFRNYGTRDAIEARQETAFMFFITTQRMVNISRGLVNMIE